MLTGMLIGEVAARSGISARMLRHYDAVGLVSPSGRTGNGYRRYEEQDLRRLFSVEALRALGLTLQEVATALADPAFSAAATIEAVATRTRERIARDEELLARLERVRSSAPGAWSDVLHTVGLLHGLAAGSPSARQRAVLSMPARSEEAVVLARAALDEADPNVAGALHWALARAGDGALPVLEEALDSPSSERRRRAVTALAKFGARGAAVLAGALGSPDPVVSGRAALVCGAHGDLGAVPRLVALVVDGPDDVEAAGVLGSLAARHDRAEAIGAALVGALEHADEAARRRLAAALAEIPGQPATATLTRLTTDPVRAVALTATAVLRQRAERDGPAGTEPPRGG